MFKKLQDRWNVNTVDLVLVLTTFAIGGSLCGWAARKILLLLDLEGGFFWVVLYIVFMTILWPFCVLMVSIPLGQYRFFTNYLGKVWRKMSGKKKATHNLAIFASGAGSNAKKIIEYFEQPGKVAKVSLIVCNKPGAGVLQVAEEKKIPTLLIEKSRFNQDGYQPELEKHGIDFIVLAGFLWKLPPVLIKAFPKKIVNIHPALLPKHGGKGMYGDFVHEAVISGRDKESGISIHYADELYDHGEIIFQEKCIVEHSDDPRSLAQKIHLLEYEHYPRTIEAILKKQKRR